MASLLTVVCGNACTGKTTWAKSLSLCTGATLLDIDTVSERLVMAAQIELGRDPNDRDSSDYKRVYRDAIHETLFALTGDNPGSTIIVAPFTRERRMSDFNLWLTEKLGRSVQIHYFVSADEIRKQRLIARGNPRDLLKLQDFSVYATLGQEETRPGYPHQWFDTSASFPDVSMYLTSTRSG